MLKKLSMLGVIMIFAMAMLLTATPQAALAKHGGKDGRAKGLITAIDTTAGTLTINDRKNGDVTVTVTDATKLRLDSKKNTTLAMLAIGDKADARYDATTLVASRVDAKSPKVEGTVTAIDLDAQTLTIQTVKGMSVTVQVDANTKIEHNAAHATLADFQLGDHAHAKYNAQTMIASRLEGGSE